MVSASAGASSIGFGKPACTGDSASGRSKKRRVGASRRSGVDSMKPPSLSLATSAATEDFERKPSSDPIDEYDGNAWCRV